MRVIAGEARGRRLFTLKGSETRPTADRVKESLFSILVPHLAGAAVLDLFAGSGALAIEALSRGAQSAVLCDRSRRAIDVIRRNLEQTGFVDRAEVWLLPADKGIRRLAAAGRSFDLIFIDPPYESGLAVLTATLAADSNLLARGGRIVIEHASKEELSGITENLGTIREVTYGDTTISILAPPT